MTATAIPAPRTGAAPAPKAGPDRLRALDGLRLLAALMVCGYHYGGRGGEVAKAWGTSPNKLFPEASTWLAYGPLGVQIFFVISGFVICMSAQGRTVRQFAASRVGRLYPAYWVAVVLVAVAVETVSPSDFLLNLTMVHQPLGAERVLGVDWTLWVELRFYVLFALCVILPGGGRRRTLMFCGVWTVAAVLADVADPSGKGFLSQALMPQYAPFFIGGVALYLVHRDHRDKLAWALALTGWLIGQHYAVAGLWHAPNPKFFSYRSSLVIIAIVTAGFALVALIALGKLGWARWKWLTVAGALTYPFYLVHEHLGWVVIEALHRRAGLSAPVTFALTVVFMLCLAWAIHRLVERPFGPRLRGLLS
ncbi:acyltransferase [Streptomyces sp. APSN-46.1]|uniref:acyltransferase family protein n=1 Tax=Streptomyces sp. APSN-46.1 TaxID=2929049 RepID=UPI001FB45888|nr:acyltransferase [Streptomyces sp. APSN-46.1]MCJ1677718.1 acyltransferase [Streptomyces sp. APSN-46.1]